MVLVEFMRGRKKSQVSVSFIIMMSIGTGHSHLSCNRNTCSCMSCCNQLISAYNFGVT